MHYQFYIEYHSSYTDVLKIHFQKHTVHDVLHDEHLSDDDTKTISNSSYHIVIRFSHKDTHTHTHTKLVSLLTV